MMKFSFYGKNLFWPKFAVFCQPYLPRSCLVWWHIIKQIFHAFFCLISKLFPLGNLIFNSASRRWILIPSGVTSDIKQKGMEYLLIIKKLPEMWLNRSFLISEVGKIVRFFFYFHKTPDVESDGIFSALKCVKTYLRWTMGNHMGK